MAEKKYDVIVIGAGPAGSSASRALVSGGMKTLLLDKRRLPRQKICSGMLSKLALDFVNKKFGVIPDKVYCKPNFVDSVALYFPSQDDKVVIPFKELVPNVWRTHFDHFLVINSGGDIKDGLIVDNIEEQDKGFKIICRQFLKNGKERKVSFKAKYLIAADGSNSNSVKQMIPGAYNGIPKSKCLQIHYRGQINILPNSFSMFFYPDIGLYSYANIKDEYILIGCNSLGKSKLKYSHANFVSLLKKKFGLKIEGISLKEGIVDPLVAPMNRFVPGKGNFLIAGNAAGFMHMAGEGISCALTTGDLAGEAILTAEKTSVNAIEVYREIVKDEADLCLDQFNPIRMLKTSPIQIDVKPVWQKYSLIEKYRMYKDIKAYAAHNNEFSDSGIFQASKKNMIYHLIHRRYPSNL